MNSKPKNVSKMYLVIVPLASPFLLIFFHALRLIIVSPSVEHKFESRTIKISIQIVLSVCVCECEQRERERHHFRFSFVSFTLSISSIIPSKAAMIFSLVNIFSLSSLRDFL